MGTPAITVLLPVFNAGSFLREAVASILAQRFADFELLIIDDGSTDGCLTALDAFTDSRIRVLHNPGNRGLCETLNRGLHEAAGDLLARMDADDICTPERLETQVRFMDAHPDIAICGSWVRIFGRGRERTYRYATEHSHLAVNLFFGYRTFCHPSVMVRRRELMDAGLFYDPKFLHIEDTDLWSRAAGRCRLANIPEVLLHYRKHPQQVSVQQRSVAQAKLCRIHARQLAAIGMPADDAAVLRHTHLLVPPPMTAAQVAGPVREWIHALVAANDATGRYDVRVFREAAGKRYWTCCSRLGLAGSATYRRARLNDWYEPSLRVRWRHLCRCLGKPGKARE